MDKQKADNLKKLLEVFNEERLNPRDFANAFKSVISYVQNAEKNLVKQLTAFTKAATDSIHALRKENAANFATLKGEVHKKLEAVKDGYTPVKGVDYFDGEDGDDGEDADEKAIEERIVARFPEIPPFETSEDIRNKLELLEGQDRLDITAINGIDELEKRVTAYRIIPTNEGTGLANSSGNIGRFQWLKFPGATITQDSATATITISGSGTTIYSDTLSGTINGSNTVFTTANTITSAMAAYLANSIYQPGVDFNVTGAKQITYTVAPDASLSGQPHWLSHT